MTEARRGYIIEQTFDRSAVAVAAEALRGLEVASDDAERVDQIRALEELRSVVAAAQARVTAAFVASQRAEQAARGRADGRIGRGVAAQVAFARRISPAQAERYTAAVTRWAGDLPHTFTALTQGRISEWRATLIARETGWLSREHRAAVDAAITGTLDAWGDRQVQREVRRVAYRLDPHGFLDHLAKAAEQRHVSTRPAPDMMCRLSALLPVAQGVAVYAALKAHADTRHAAGDTRTRAQVMADTLVERLTGQATATAVPIEINLVLTDTTLFHLADEPDGANDRAAASSNATVSGTVDPARDPHEPAYLAGYGPIPAKVARQLIHNADKNTALWLRRLYRHPATGELVTMETRRRRFTPAQRRFIELRDQTCRTPWCDAPIRHADHVTAHDDGGPTSLTNCQGLCEACNYAKQALGWWAKCAAHTTITTTPTGHQYTSRPPDPPGAQTRDG